MSDIFETKPVEVANLNQQTITYKIHQNGYDSRVIDSAGKDIPLVTYAALEIDADMGVHVLTIKILNPKIELVK